MHSSPGEPAGVMSSLVSVGMTLPPVRNLGHPPEEVIRVPPMTSSLLPGQVLDQLQDMPSLIEPFRGPRLCEEKSLLGTTELVPDGDQIRAQGLWCCL